MNALVPVQQSNVEAYRASTDAADLCKEIVVATAKKLGDRQYVCVEGWQAIAIAHGCTASARGVERVDGGIRAIGEVRRMSDGAVIAEAEGFVGEDEPTWFGGTMRTWKWGEQRGQKVWFDKEMPKRADYAIRAMAQTRAISRACRSAFAHVVVMMNANLSTTPAEEVPDGGFQEADYTPVEKSVDRPKERDAVVTITPEQEIMLEDKMREAAVDKAKFLDFGGFKATKDIPADQFEGAMRMLQARINERRQAAASQQASQSRPSQSFGELLDDEIPNFGAN